MNSIARLLSVAALAAVASPALAQNPTSVDIVGTAEAFCSLPNDWQFASSTNNVSMNQFSSRTWTIPGALLANNQGQGVVSTDEVAIRVRGSAMCNTPHTITLRSANGGLRHEASIGAPPPGFQTSRRMVYNANWRDTANGIFNWIPQSPGDSQTYVYNVAPPGIHDFDIRMGLLRDPTAGPMIAGSYSDQLIVTISIPG